MNIDDVALSTDSGLVIHNRSPYVGQVGLEGSTLIRFTLTTAPTGSITLAKTVVKINGVLAYDAGVFTPPFAGPGSTVTSSISTWSMAFSIDGVDAYASRSEVTVEVSSQDSASNTLDETYTFTIKDTTAPRVEKVFALDRNIVQVVFTDNVTSLHAAAVAVDFPWGTEALTWDGSDWIYDPLTYPYVSTGVSAPYSLVKDTLLTVVVDGEEHTVPIPSDETTAAGVASALTVALGMYGVSAWAFGGKVWMRSGTVKGSIEVKPGGAQGALQFELGSQGPRVAYYTTPGTYTLPVSILGLTGVVSQVSIEYALEGFTFRLQTFEEIFTDSVLDPTNYVLTIDTARVQSEINPTYVTTVDRVERASDSSVLLYLEKAMTQGGFYIMTVDGVYDNSGNIIDPLKNSGEFSGFVPSEMMERDWDIYSLYAAFNRRQDEDRGLVFKKFCAVLKEVSLQWLSDIDYIFRWQDIAQAPERVVDGMLANLGNPFGCISIDAVLKKQLIGFLTTLYKEKGTEKGIGNAIRFFLGIDPITFKYYWGTGWMLGKPGRGELGVSTVLNSGKLRDRYSFSIIVNRVLTEVEKEGIQCIVRVLKPSHTHFITIIEPTPPFVPDHWMIPWSGFGSTTILH